MDGITIKGSVISLVLKILFLGGISFAPFLYAQIEHHGVVGGPFHGYLGDTSGQVRVQVGPIADFSVPSGLSARAMQSRISSGGSSQLSASLILDDDTFTSMDPSQIEWSFSKPHLSVNNGILLAEVMPKLTSVRVRAFAEGFEQSFTIFILADDFLVAEEAKARLPEVLRSAIDLESSGWKESEWFGIFYDAPNGWLYHVDHGWLHSSPGGTDAAWFWNEQQQWFWTGPKIYPHLYRNRDATWLYFFRQALPRKIFYNYTSEKLEHVSER